MYKQIDARGMQCPLPVLEVKKAIEEMTEGGTIEVTVDNDIAVQNIVKLAKQKQISAECISGEHSHHVVRLILSEANGSYPVQVQEPMSDLVQDNKQKSKNMVVVLSSNTMGSGEEELGRILMKGFLFSLTKQELLPDHILLYNSGIFLACEGSESLEDLRLMQEEGVEITACGTCLDYYNMKEKQTVGDVSNMYSITMIMENADLIIRP